MVHHRLPQPQRRTGIAGGVLVLTLVFLLSGCSTAHLEADRTALANVVARAQLPDGVGSIACEEVALFDVEDGVTSYVGACLSEQNSLSVVTSMAETAHAIAAEVDSTPSAWTCEPLSEATSFCYAFIPWSANSRNDIRINARVAGLHRELPPPDLAGDVQFAVVLVPTE